MKKSLSVFMFLAVVFVLIACSGDQNNNLESSNGDNNTNDTTGSNESNGSNEDGDEEVTVSIANWTLGSEGEANNDRLMIEEFEKAFPHIKVEIDESIDPEDWNGSLSAAASASSMPDVFLLAQIPTGLANDWLLDLSEFTSDDDDFAQVPDAVKEAIAYDDNTYALPAGQHFLGYLDRKSTRLNSSHVAISYAVCCLTKTSIHNN